MAIFVGMAVLYLRQWNSFTRVRTIGCGAPFDELYERTKTMAREPGFCRIRYRGFQVDVFLPTIPFYDEARSRRRRVELEGQFILIWDAETLCVFKMVFFRLKDLADAEQILYVQGSNLDTAWVHKHLRGIYGDRDPRVSQWIQLVEQTR